MRNLDYIRLDGDYEASATNGFMSLLANVTRTGVFTYFEKSPDGTVRMIRQLRHPEEVFAEASLNSLMGLPATNLHPEELVSTENAKKLVVGMTSDRPKKISLDEDADEYVQQKVTFFDSKTIDMIKSGSRREMSLGYICDLEESSGEWNGEKYDYIQRNINYNHLSLVDRARGGSECRVLLDGKETAFVVDNDGHKKQFNCDGISFFDDDDLENEEMKVFLKDGKEYKVSEDAFEVFKAMDAANVDLKQRASDLETELEKSKATVDAQKATLDALNSDENKKKEEEKFAKAVEAKVNLVSKSSKVIDGADFSGLSDIEIKKKVIAHINADADLAEKSDAYIDAMFDIVVDGYKAPSNEKTIGKTKMDGDQGEKTSYEAARARAWERDRKLSIRK